MNYAVSQDKERHLQHSAELLCGHLVLFHNYGTDLAGPLGKNFCKNLHPGRQN